ncbi:hypothetical protein NPIL_470731 [Nephila pilipes]|uniref:Uncharacterized protein n=1 Tax=Nephila pilipes TaxID=299642 RepID=A0A8X6ICY7_NEPPI|nr:hypothetical protein NPIL_470731 [Nephila pilipes]
MLHGTSEMCQMLRLISVGASEIPKKSPGNLTDVPYSRSTEEAPKLVLIQERIPKRTKVCYPVKQLRRLSLGENSSIVHISVTVKPGTGCKKGIYSTAVRISLLRLSSYKKKFGAPWLYVDERRLNKYVIRDRFSKPLDEEYFR